MHIPTEKTLWAYTAGLLSQRRHLRIARHLTRCAACRQRVAEYSTLIHSANENPPLPVDDAQVLGQRNLLMAAIETGNRSISVRQQNRRFQRAWQTVAVMGVFVMGLILGRQIPHGPGTPQSKHVSIEENGVSASAPFEILPVSGSTDRVELRYRTLEKHSLKGRLETQAIQSALAVSLLSEPRTNIRLKHLAFLRPRRDNRIVIETLAQVALHDENPGMRLKALELLAPMIDDSTVKKTILNLYLHDTLPGIRVQAASALRHSQDADIISILREHAEKDPYARAVLLTQGHCILSPHLDQTA